MRKKLLNLFNWFVLLFRCVKEQAIKNFAPEKEKKYTYRYIKSNRFFKNKYLKNGR